MLILQNDTMEKICFHAESEYPRECCGIILGRRFEDGRTAYKIIRTENGMKKEQASTEFLINPLEIVRTELLAEEEKLEIVGFYHSHPDYEAVVSELDMLHMIAGYSYLIVSVKNGKCVQTNSFEKRAQTDTGAKEETLIKEK